MINLVKSLAAFGSPDFDKTLSVEIAQLNADQLPLQAGLSLSNYALDENLKVTILNTENDDRFIHVKAGIFYEGVIAGCSCADDPTPIEAQPEYCEVNISIDRETAGTNIALNVPE